MLARPTETYTQCGGTATGFGSDPVQSRCGTEENWKQNRQMKIPPSMIRVGGECLQRVAHCRESEREKARADSSMPDWKELLRVAVVMRLKKERRSA